MKHYPQLPEYGMSVTPLTVGSNFQNRYRIIASIGSGGMAEVFHGFDEALKRDVAIKVLHQNLLSEDDLARFVRECKIFALLTHPNFVRIYNYGISAHQAPFIVMEYVEGCSLRRWLSEHEKMDCAETLKMGFALCDALSYAHDKGVVHRDLNPNNILLEGGDPLKPKIIDFGLSILKHPDRASTYVTRAGTLMGTPNYLSPEQCAGEPADQRTDVYALGCTLYECISGQKAFDAESVVAVIYKHLNESPCLLSTHTPVLEGVDQLLQHALAKELARRYHTMTEVAEDIQLILRGQGDEVTLDELSTKEDTTVDRSGSRLKRAIIFCLLLPSLWLCISDPGIASLPLRAAVYLPPTIRAEFLSNAADLYEYLAKPRAREEAYQVFFSSTETLDKAPLAVGLKSLRNYAKILRFSDQGGLTESSSHSAFLSRYLHYLAVTLTSYQNEYVTAKPRPAELAPAELGEHLGTIANLTGLMGQFPFAESDLTRMQQTTANQEDMLQPCAILATLIREGNLLHGNRRMAASDLCLLGDVCTKLKKPTLSFGFDNHALLRCSLNDSDLRPTLLRRLWTTESELAIGNQMAIHLLSIGKDIAASKLFHGAEQKNFLITYGELLCFVGDYEQAALILSSVLKEPDLYEYADADYLWLLRAEILAGNSGPASHQLTKFVEPWKRAAPISKTALLSNALIEEVSMSPQTAERRIRQLNLVLTDNLKLELKPLKTGLQLNLLQNNVTVDCETIKNSRACAAALAMPVKQIQNIEMAASSKLADLFLVAETAPPNTAKQLLLEEEILLTLIEMKHGDVASGQRKIMKWIGQAKACYTPQLFNFHATLLARSLIACRFYNQCEAFCQRLLHEREGPREELRLRLALCKFQSGKYAEARSLCNLIDESMLPLDECTRLDNYFLLTRLTTPGTRKAKRYAQIAAALYALRFGQDASSANYLLQLKNSETSSPQRKFQNRGNHI